jgi:hypothetical protein
MAEFDGDIAKEAADAASRGNVLRFVGKVDVEKGVGSVELGEFPKTHPFAGLQGADNVVEIQARSISHWSPYDRVRVSLRPGSLAFNPDTPRRLSTPLLTPFNSTPTFVRSYGPSTLSPRGTAPRAGARR